jgi:hypothetical protein
MVPVVQIILQKQATREIIARNGQRKCTRTICKSSTCIESSVTRNWSPAAMAPPTGAYPVGFWCTASSVDVPFSGSQLVAFMNPRNCPSAVCWNANDTCTALVEFGAGAAISGASTVVPPASLRPETPGPGSAEAGSPGSPLFAPSE